MEEMQEIREVQEVKETKETKQEVDIESVLRRRLNEEARALGFEDWDTMQAKLLEEKGRYYELLEKVKKEAEEKQRKAQEEIANLKRQYEETIVRHEALKHFKDAIDPEKAFKLFRTEKEIYVKDGKVYADGEPIEKAIEKFLTENPFLLKPTQKQGAGTTPAQAEKEMSPQDKLRQAFRKLIGGER